MKTFKLKRAKPEIESKVPMHHVMNVILPCVMLACKDEYDSSPEELQKLGARINRYISHIANGYITVKDLHQMMEVRDASRNS